MDKDKNKKNDIIEKLILISICLVVFSGSSSIASFNNVILIFALLLMIGRNLMNKKINVFSKYLYNKIIIISIIVLIAMLPFSIDVYASLKYILVFTTMFVISIQLIDKDKILNELMSLMLGFSVVIALSIILSQIVDDFCGKYFSILLPLKESSLNMYYNEMRGNIYSGLSFERAFAATALTLGISVIYTRIILDKENGKKNFIMLILLFVALFSTGKRMHFLINIFNLLLVFGININKKNLIKAFKLLVPMILVLVIILLKVPTAQKVFIRLFDGESYYTIQSRDDYYWKYCAEMFGKNPFIGTGINTFKTYIGLQKTDNIYDAHNIYLQLLGETGIVGFGLFLTIFFVLFMYSINALKRFKKQKKLTCFAILLQSTFLIYGLSGNPLYYTSQLLFYFIAIIFINNIMYKGENEEYERNINNNIS